MSFETPPFRPQREPMFNAPTAVMVLIGLLVAIHVGRLVLDPDADFRLLIDFGFIPARLLVALSAERLDDVLAHIATLDPSEQMQQVALARFVLAGGEAAPWTLLTHAFLHGSWLHLGFNTLWLLAFGSPVARRFGTGRFLVFFVVCALGGAAAHLATHVNDVIPMVGASGAISGCMAAAVRFVFQPGAPMHILHRDPDAADLQPAQSLGAVLRDRRAAVFLVVWFASNLVFGLTGDTLGVGGAIAWQAHVGGFLAGFLLFPLFDPVRVERRTRV